MEVLGQIVGFISFGIAFVLYQIKDRKHLLIVQSPQPLVMINQEQRENQQQYIFKKGPPIA